MKQAETKFKERIIPILKALPRSWWLKIQLVAMRGIPDYLACVNGRFVAIELKRKGAKADPRREKLQRWVCLKIRLAGGLAFERVDAENFDTIYRQIVDSCYPPDEGKILKPVWSDNHKD